MSILENSFSNLDDLEDQILELYTETIEGGYIPAIVSEGKYDAEAGEDFYLKLILAHQNVKLDRTWLIDNLALYIADPDFREEESLYDCFIYNLITLRRVKGNSLYQLNPVIATDMVEEYEYDDNKIVNAFFHDAFNEKPVLKKSGRENLLLLFSTIEGCINEIKTDIFPKYKLIAEYEYRTHDHILSDIADGMIETKNGICKVSHAETGTWLLGSINLPKPNDNIRKERDVQVFDLETGKATAHNPRNFDNDRDLHVIVLKMDASDVFEKDYYLYDLMLFDKANTDDKYLIDMLGDKMVMWEGEYNKLPPTTKDAIDGLSFIPPDAKGLISSGMYAWQLNSDWNYHEKLDPSQLLAFKIRHRYFNNAIELGLTFFPPQNTQAFQRFILIIEKLTGIKLDVFDSRLTDVQLLIRILKGDEVEIGDEALKDLFMKYCYHICGLLNDE